MSIPQRVKEFLEFKELSQKQFCVATGYSENNLSNFLTGRTQTPRIDLLEAIANHYPDISLHWILTGEESMLRGAPPPPPEEEGEPQPTDPEARILNRLLIRHIREIARAVKKDNPELYYKLGLDGLLEDLGQE